MISAPYIVLYFAITVSRTRKLYRVSELEQERHEIRRLSDAVHIKTQVSGSPVRHRLSSSIRF